MPMGVYLFISAVIFRITPDVKINARLENIRVIQYEDDYFIYSTEEASYEDGLIILYNGYIGAVIDSDDIVKIGIRYYSYIEENNMMQLKELKLIEKETSFRFPIAIFISLLGIVISILVVMKKLDIMKQYPYESALLSLWVLALVFILINFIVDSLTVVFVIAAISFTVFYLEQKFTSGTITKSQLEKRKSELTKQLERLNNA